MSDSIEKDICIYYNRSKGAPESDIVYYRGLSKMDMGDFAREFIKIFPENEIEYHSHLMSYGEILGHVFFSNLINQPLSQLLLANENKTEIQKYIDFIEIMYSSGNNDVQNVVVVTILAYLGDEDLVLRNAFTYFSGDIIQASSDYEKGIRRRVIKVSRKKVKSEGKKGKKSKIVIFAKW